MVYIYSKQFNEDKEIFDKDFTIFIKKNEPPYAKTNDDSIIRLIEGVNVNIIYSASIDTELTPVYEILKSNDLPNDSHLIVKK